MIKIIGIGECAISDNPQDIIATYALASCVAVTAYNPLKKVAGMVHIILPGTLQKQENSSGPYYYAITGIPMMINRMYSDYGCSKSELRIRILGGAESVRKDDIFQLGKKNIMMAEKVLKSMKLDYDSTETGGFISRSILMDVNTGKITIKSQPINI